jgi:hypothetical protein
MTDEQKARRLETCRRYRERNRETVRANAKKWQQANKDVGTRWYQAHREEILEKSRKERAEANKEARFALAKRQEERAERQKKYAAKREAAKAFADKGMKRCAMCGEGKPVSSFGVVTYSSGTKGPRSNCFECRRSDWSNATEEEKAERSEINNERHRIRRIGSVRIWNPPVLCSAKGCTTFRSTGGRIGPIKEGALCDKHHAEKQRRNLDDPYVACKLKRSIGVKNPPQELIELKRVQLKIHRLINRGSEI